MDSRNPRVTIGFCTSWPIARWIARPQKGCYYDEHVLVNLREGSEVPQPVWEWAEIDCGRRVWTERGNVFASRLTLSGLAPPTLLQDFNGMKFMSRVAPY